MSLATHPCPSCSHTNPADASFCSACGLALVTRCPNCVARNLAAATICRQCGITLVPGGTGMVRLPMLPTPPTPPVPAARPPESPPESPTDPASVPRLTMQDAVWIEAPAALPSAFTLSLRDLDDPAAVPDAVIESGSVPELIRSDPDPDPKPVVPAAPADADPGAADSDAAAPEDALRAAALQGVSTTTTKSERRAAVRRERLSGQAARARALQAPPDALVLDPHPAARSELCALLEGFGFRAHPARDATTAGVLLAERSYAVVFLNIVFDGSDSDVAAELCRSARRAPTKPVGRVAALVVTGSGSRPMDRVRASMAGADQFLVKPVRRGDVARALDACGVPMPRDPRHT